MLKAIIFDWHGVLDKVTFASMVKMVSDFSGAAVQKIRSELQGWDEKYALRGISPVEYWKFVKDNFKLSDADLDKARNYLLGVELNKDLWEKLPELKEKYKLVVLSDCAGDKADNIRASVDLSIFDKVYLSAESGIGKSSDSFFTHALEDIGVKPEECLYVDDSDVNVLKALRLGFQTCHFEKTKDVEDCLT